MNFGPENFSMHPRESASRDDAVRVLILWSDQESANLGVQVLARGLAALVQAAAHPRPVHIEYKDLRNDGSAVDLGKRGVLKNLVRRGGSTIDSYLRTFDLVVDSGAGDSLTDLYGLQRLVLMTYTQRRILQHGVPLVLGPQTIGPFSRAIATSLVKPTLRRAHAVIARDTTSLAVARELGATDPVLSTDVVFALPAPSDRTVERDVIVNLSGLLWQGGAGIDGPTYRRLAYALVDSLLSQGRSVSLLPHVLENPTADRDATAMQAMQSKYGSTLEYLTPTGLDDARALISTGVVLVGSRMHACLNALSLGVPAFPWAYSRKFAPLLAGLGWSHGADLAEPAEVADLTLRMLARWTSDPPHAELEGLQQQATRRLAPTIAAIKGALPRPAE